MTKIKVILLKNRVFQIKKIFFFVSKPLEIFLINLIFFKYLLGSNKYWILFGCKKHVYLIEQSWLFELTRHLFITGKYSSLLIQSNQLD